MDVLVTRCHLATYFGLFGSEAYGREISHKRGQLNSIRTANVDVYRTVLLITAQ